MHHFLRATPRAFGAVRHSGAPAATPTFSTAVLLIPAIRKQSLSGDAIAFECDVLAGRLL
jgi:hypothetical protein